MLPFTQPIHQAPYHLQHIIGEAVYFAREILAEAVRSSTKYDLDLKVSMDGCHMKELQGGCEGEKPGILFTALFTVLAQPSQCIITLSTTVFTSFCNSLINNRQWERKNEREKKTGVLDNQPMAAPNSINENKDVPCSCRRMASQKTTKKSIIISIIKLLVHWKFSLIPQSISQGKNKFCHFDWLILQDKNQNIEEAFNSIEGCKLRIASHWICNCGRDMYTRADKHVDDQRSKWKETGLTINKAPKPFFQKHTIYCYQRWELW